MLDLDTTPPSSIDLRFIEESLELVKRKRRWEASKWVLLPLVGALENLGIEPTFNDSLALNFTGDAAKLYAVVKCLRIAGFSAKVAVPPKKGDTSWYAYYDNPNCKERVWLYFTSSVCKRVKIGTETVERDVFETQCADISGAVAELPSDETPAIEGLPL